jgi:Family of unknown function (DUF5946)
MILCAECGATLPDGGECIDNFHALLLLEYDVTALPTESSEGRGELAHFYAVSSYVLQHPNSMNYTKEALGGARQNISDVLAGRMTLSMIRHQVRLKVNGSSRVVRREGDAVVCWPIKQWPIKIDDVIAGGIEGYCLRVTAWAESVVKTLATAITDR